MAGNTSEPQQRSANRNSSNLFTLCPQDFDSANQMAHSLLTAALVIVFYAPFVALRTAKMQTAFSEGFEAGGKTSYAAGNVALSTGSWYMDDALTGNLSSDRKTGDYSARVRNIGRVRMNFNKTGAGTVSIHHAIFGSDGPSTWQLSSSTDEGNTWAQVGTAVTTSSATLQTATFVVNNANAIRFELRKVSGGANRMNLDNIQITDFACLVYYYPNLGFFLVHALRSPCLRGDKSAENHCTTESPCSYCDKQITR